MKIYRNSLNLFNKLTDIKSYYLTSDNGIYTPTALTSRTALLECSGQVVYTFTVHSRTFRVSFFSSLPAGGSQPILFNNFDYGLYEIHSNTITAPASAQYMAIFCYSSSTEAQDYTESQVFDTLMINEGTQIPYEPYNVVDWYGYKYKLRSSGAWSELDDKKAPWKVTSNAKVLRRKRVTKSKT